MTNATELQASYELAYIILPSSILDWFSLVRVEEQKSSKKPSRDSIWSGIELHIYLDEKDNRSEEEQTTLSPNGFTEPTIVQDFPIRDHKVYLHIRRRRWLTTDGRNVLLSTYPLAAEGTRLSAEFASFLKGEDGHISRDSATAWDLLPD